MNNLVSKHGGYKNLKSFQMSEIVFDLTMEFTKRYINSFKLKDQIEGAARSGKQNIGEGSQNSGTSKTTELRLLNVARGSLEELLMDYRDFLRTNHFTIWDKNDSRVLKIRELAYRTDRSYSTYKSYMSDPEVSANCAISLINQTNFLLDQQIKSLEKDLAEKGDFKERYNQRQKLQLFGHDDDFDEFIKQFNQKRLENGKIVSLNEPE